MNLSMQMMIVQIGKLVSRRKFGKAASLCSVIPQLLLHTRGFAATGCLVIQSFIHYRAAASNCAAGVHRPSKMEESSLLANGHY